MTLTSDFSMLVCGAAQGTIPAAYGDLSLQGSKRGCSAVFACNAYIDEQAPWALRKTDPAADGRRCSATLYICIAVLAVVIRPVIPAARTGCSTKWAWRPSCGRSTAS